MDRSCSGLKVVTRVAVGDCKFSLLGWMFEGCREELLLLES